MRIESLLSHGQQNAIPLRHLCSMTGINERTVRNMIAVERIEGAPILSSSGYYLPANAEEKARFVRSMRHRAKEILRAANAVEKARVES